MENVLPQRAEAIVNLRLLSGDNIDYAIEYVKRAVGDQRVKVGITGNTSCEASKISDVRSEGFKILERTIRQVFPDSIVAPCLVPASTDARHYGEISDNIFRFLPVRMDKDDFKRIHGTNERIGVDNYKNAVDFYIQLIRNSN
jgi:carboxypeptidase PM20D1